MILSKTNVPLQLKRERDGEFCNIQSTQLEYLYPNYTQVLNVKYTTTQMQSEHYVSYAILSKIALHTKTIIKLHMTP